MGMVINVMLVNYAFLFFAFGRVVISADAPYIKMVSEQFDRCHGTLLQYVEFLCSAVMPVSTYAKLVPSLDDLVHLYHLDPEVSFCLYLCSFTCWLLLELLCRTVHNFVCFA